MKFWNPTPVTISAINAAGWDADLIVPAARLIQVDHIAETTPAHGIVTNQLLAPALGVTVPAGQILAADRIDVDHMRNLTPAHGIVITSGDALRVDHISEATGGHNLVLDNTETGRQTGTGNSATGALLANSFGGSTGAAAVACCACIIKRAGTYRVWVYNEIVYGGGQLVNVFVNNALQFSSTAANAAQTNENCGDRVYAVGDIVVAFSSAAVAGQFIILSFRNADGMWE